MLNYQECVNPRTVSFDSRLQDHSVCHQHKESQVAGLDSQDRKEFPIQHRYLLQMHTINRHIRKIR